MAATGAELLDLPNFFSIEPSMTGPTTVELDPVQDRDSSGARKIVWRSGWFSKVDGRYDTVNFSGFRNGL